VINSGGLSEAEARHFMRPIIEALAYIHELGVAHRDVKLENILIPNDKTKSDQDFLVLSEPVSQNDSGCEDECCLSSSLPAVTSFNSSSVRLIDMGSATSAKSWHRLIRTTSMYRPPELILKLRWGYECDIWCLGCVIVEMALGKTGFESRSDIEHLFRIQHMIGPVSTRMREECCNADLYGYFCGNLIMPSALEEDVRKEVMSRPVLGQVLGEIDLDLRDLVLRMLEVDPLKRITIDQVLEHPFLKPCSD
jgi:serine/threonine protein kinase